jgi:hypothetical protein
MTEYSSHVHDWKHSVYSWISTAGALFHDPGRLTWSLLLRCCAANYPSGRLLDVANVVHSCPPILQFKISFEWILVRMRSSSRSLYFDLTSSRRKRGVSRHCVSRNRYMMHRICTLGSFLRRVLLPATLFVTRFIDQSFF